jgi:selenophosphate synthetase-related protein
VEELDRIVGVVRELPGLRAKSGLGLVTEVLGPTDWLSGPGDDAAATTVDGLQLLAAGEALLPAFVARDPYGAGVGAVVANVNDVAAMGGRCLGIVDTMVATREVARRVLEGLRYAGDLYGVPIVGGHLTMHDGPPSLSAFAYGTASKLLSARNVAPEQVLLHACSIEGRMREDFPFFPSFDERSERVRGDLALLPELAERGLCVACKDVSMAGLLGSLAMLLEPTRCGVNVDLDRLPRPPGVPLERWVGVFPSFGFLLCVEAEHVRECVKAFADRELACEAVGTLDATGCLRASLRGSEAVVLDLGAQPVTGL